MTDLPKNKFCEVCSNAKIQRVQKRRTTTKTATGEVKVLPTKFGEKVTGDHFIKNVAGYAAQEDPNSPVDTVAVVLYDRATKWLAV